MYQKVSVAEAAKLLGKSQQFVRIGLQRQRLPIGTAVMTDEKSGRWSYHISPGLLKNYLEGVQHDH